MKTTSELKDLLREAGCRLDTKVDAVPGIEWWRDNDGKLRGLQSTCSVVLGRCLCCGEGGAGVSSACSARHENKGCNCYPCSRCGFERAPECDKYMCKPKEIT